MEDAELAAIRAARLQQLRQNAGSSSPSSLPTPQGIPGGSSNNEADSAKREAEEQMRRDLLATVLDQKARERRKLAILYACVLSNTDWIVPVYLSCSHCPCQSYPIESN